MRFPIVAYYVMSKPTIIKISCAMFAVPTFPSLFSYALVAQKV